MSSFSARTQFRALRSDLANLPPSMANQLYAANLPAQNTVVRITWTAPGSGKSSSAYIGWSGIAAGSAGSASAAAGSIGTTETIEIDPAYANDIGLPENTTVSLQLVPNPPEAYTVHLEPASASDWELVEIHAQLLEDRLLNQVRAVAVGSRVTVFPTATAHATLHVVSVEPPGGPVWRLAPTCEIVVAPKTRKPKRSATTRSGKSRASGGRSRAEPPRVLLRAVPLPHPLYSEMGQTPDFTLYTDSVPLLPRLGPTEFVFVSVVNPPFVEPKKYMVADSPSTETSTETSEPKEPLKPSVSIAARLVHWPDGTDGSAGVSAPLAAALGISANLGSVVAVQTAPKPLSQTPECIIVHPYITQNGSGLSSTASTTGLQLKPNRNTTNLKSGTTDSNPEFVQQLHDELAASGLFKAALTHKCQLAPLQSLPLGGIAEFKQHDGWLLPRSDRDFAVEIGSPVLRPESEVAQPPAEPPKPVAYDKLIHNVTRKATARSGGCYLYGAAGSGKSALLSAVGHQLYSSGFRIIAVDCATLASESGNGTPKQSVTKLFLEAAWYAPTAVLLDNLDRFVPAEAEHGGAEATAARQTAEHLCREVRGLAAQRQIAIVATGVARESIHPVLLQSHVLEDCFRILPPDRDMRAEILEAQVAQQGYKPGNGIDFVDVAAETEGFLPADLVAVVERAIVAKAEENVATVATVADTPTLNDNSATLDPDLEFTLTPNSFTSALTSFTPASLRHAHLQKSTTKWSDIGGLSAAKATLLETLEWPTKYAPIFASCPLRLRSGILLYGYPGCGKTLLASAVAAQCGLNFISIKGPEILNKYIGASEQSVRELFEKAQAAKPCVLFFDEFDSIAPKRGHDSTGVTDRVVNQMLTQMDGAEGLDGVYVLAATSRPDLIDSALLRPGRLDKCVLCGMPDAEDRAGILEAATRGMKLEGVDLSNVAQHTSGFSGADLQAVAYNAYLAAVHEKLEAEEQEGGETEENIEFVSIFDSSEKPTGRGEALRQMQALAETLESGEFGTTETGNGLENSEGIQKSPQFEAKVVVKMEHFVKSLNDTKPSISVAEQQRLEKIYRSFVAGRSGEMPDGSASTDIGGRTTLM